MPLSSRSHGPDCSPVPAADQTKNAPIRDDAGGALDVSSPRAAPERAQRLPNDYRLLPTEPNTADRLVPTVDIVATAATAINAAIRPYSMAVAPLRSRSTRRPDELSKS